MRAASKLVIAAALAGGCKPHVPPGDPRDAGAAPTAAAPAAPVESGGPRLLYASGPPSFAGLVDRVRGGVVAIRAASPVEGGPAAMYPGGAADPALGTGFLVEAGGVHVLTTDRVAAGSPALTVVLADGAALPARVVGRDPRLDIALLSIDAPRATALPLGDSERLAVGDWVLALGNPFGAGVTASAGIVSATGREGAGSQAAGQGFRTYIQTDARIHRGNSGGPLIDAGGKVVGVAVATGDRPGELGFAVPIHQVRARLEALRENGAVARAWLGIKVQPVTADVATRLGLPAPVDGKSGAHVTEVVAGSPALKAGLQVGDVVLRWDGQEIDQRSLPWKVETAPVGRAVAVAIWRDGGERTVKVAPERMPE